MLKETIKGILIRRDHLSPEEADIRIAEAREEFYDLLEEGESDLAYNICMEHFGLEPDYLDDLM